MRRNILVLNWLAAFFWMAMYAYMPNLPVYAQSLGADAVTLGVIGGVYGAAQILLRVPLGIRTDRTGRSRRMLIAGSAVLALSCAILIAAWDTRGIIMGRLVAGAAAAWWVVLTTAYADCHTEEGQMRAQGILSASSNAGKVAAAVAGGLIAQYFGVHSVFIFSFFVAVVCVVLSAGLVELPKQPQQKCFRDLVPLLKNRELMIICGIGAVTQMIAFAGPTYFTSIAAYNLQATGFDIGMLLLVFFLSTSAASLFVGSKAYNRIGGVNMLAISFLVSAVSCLPFFYHISLAFVYGVQVAAGLGYGISSAATAGLLIRSTAPKQRGTANGIFQSVYGIGILFGPVLVGSITKTVSGGQANWSDPAYWVLAAVCGAAALLSWLLIPKKYAAM